jgi:hypothetical protein
MVGLYLLQELCVFIIKTSHHSYFLNEMNNITVIYRWLSLVIILFLKPTRWNKISSYTQTNKCPLYNYIVLHTTGIWFITFAILNSHRVYTCIRISYYYIDFICWLYIVSKFICEYNVREMFPLLQWLIILVHSIIFLIYQCTESEEKINLKK